MTERGSARSRSSVGVVGRSDAAGDWRTEPRSVQARRDLVTRLPLRWVRKVGGRVSPDGWAAILIVVLVLAANAIYLLDISDPNPLGPNSGLTSAHQPGFVTGSPTIDPNIGFTAQALGHRAMLDLVHGHLPWWNPHEGTGMPLAGEMQSGALFPPNILLLLSNGQLYLHILLEIVAGLATYFLLRHVGLARLACFAGAAAFALNGTFSWLQHATFNPVAFLPLALLGIERARAATLESRPGGWHLLALAGALSFLAGFPETTYLDTLMCVVWFGWRLIGGLTAAQRKQFAKKVAIGTVLAGLLSAPLAIAFVDFTSHAFLAGHAGGGYGSQHLPAQGVAQLLVPYVYGPILTYADGAGVLTFQWDYVGGYITVSLLVLAVWGLFGRERRGLRITLAVLSVLVFSRIYGVPLFGHVLDVLPGMKDVISFRYAAPVLELSVIVLAAIGVDDAIRKPRLRVVLGVGLASIGVLVGVWKGSENLRMALGPTFPHGRYVYGALAWCAVTVLAVSMGAALLRSPRARGAVLAAVLALDMLAMFIVPELSAPRAVAIDYAPVRYLQKHLGTGRVFTLGPLSPNYGSYWALGELNVNDGVALQNFHTYVQAHLNQAASANLFTGTFGGPPGTPTNPANELVKNLAGYQMASVSYVLSPPNLPIPRTPSLALVAKTPTAWIYRLAGAAPLFDTPRSDCRTTTHSVTSATVDCTGTRTLVYHETTQPGWSATVDGRSVTVRPAGLFQSVRIPPGRHTVSFDYQPPGILWGELAFVIGAIAFIIPARQRTLLRRTLRIGRTS
jgi:hypothetical protein